MGANSSALEHRIRSSRVERSTGTPLAIQHLGVGAGKQRASHAFGPGEEQRVGRLVHFGERAGPLPCGR